MLIEGVTGFSFEARPWIVADQKIILNRKYARAGQTLQKMLEAADDGGVQCRGPYDIVEGAPVPWEKICTPDLLACLVRVRIATDPELSINHVCQQCGERLNLKIDLENLTYSSMSPAALSNLRSPDKHLQLLMDPTRPKLQLYDPATCEPKLPADIDRSKLLTMSLRMLYTPDHKTLAKLQREEPDGSLEFETCLRIVSVKLPGAAADAPAIQGVDRVRAWYRKQPWNVQRYVDDFIDKLEGGPDTDVEIDCSSCRTTQKFRIPFGPDFFGMRSI